MQTVTMDEAKAQLPELLEAAAETCQTFKIVDASGKVLTVSVASTKAPLPLLPRRAGFMKGEFVIPDDFKKYDDEVAKMFGIEE